MQARQVLCSPTNTFSTLRKNADVGKLHVYVDLYEWPASCPASICSEGVLRVLSVALCNLVVDGDEDSAICRDDSVSLLIKSAFPAACGEHATSATAVVEINLANVPVKARNDIAHRWTGAGFQKLAARKIARVAADSNLALPFTAAKISTRVSSQSSRYLQQEAQSSDSRLHGAVGVWRGLAIALASVGLLVFVAGVISKSKKRRTPTPTHDDEDASRSSDGQKRLRSRNDNSPTAVGQGMLASSKSQSSGLDDSPVPQDEMAALEMETERMSFDDPAMDHLPDFLNLDSGMFLGTTFFGLDGHSPTQGEQDGPEAKFSGTARGVSRGRKLLKRTDSNRSNTSTDSKDSKDGDDDAVVSRVAEATEFGFREVAIPGIAVASSSEFHVAQSGMFHSALSSLPRANVSPEEGDADGAILGKGPLLKRKQKRRTRRRGSTPMRWDAEHDRRLLELYKAHSEKDTGAKHLHIWKRISDELPGRTAAQCRNRWVDRVDPSLRFEEWTPEEDSALLTGRANGTSWSKMLVEEGSCLKGRAITSMKNRWISLQRKIAREKKSSRASVRK